MQSQLTLPRRTEHDLRMFAVKVQARGGIRCHRRSYQEEERDEEEHVEKRPTWLRCAAQRARGHASVSRFESRSHATTRWYHDSARWGLKERSRR